MDCVTPRTMNPYTAHLQSLLPPGRGDDIVLAEFVAGWDRVEAFVIRVFRANIADGADASEWDELRRALAARYAAFADTLAVYWPHALVAGERCTADPFRAVLDVATASSLVANRTAMQTLPAARETLNRWLVVLADDAVDPPVTPPAAPPAPARPTSEGTSTGPAA